MKLGMVSPLLVLVLAAASPPELGGQPVTPSDPDLARGIRLVEEGAFNEAILAIDAAARRLSAASGRTLELAQAYLYLGIAYVGLGHETSATAKFREALAQAKDMNLSPEQFPPKVIELFEKARQESLAIGPAPTPAKKGGSGKTLLFVGLGGLAAAGAGLALSGGGGGSAAQAEIFRTEVFSGNMGGPVGRDQASERVTAGKAGAWKAELSWTNPNVRLHMEVFDDAGRLLTGERALTSTTAIAEFTSGASAFYQFSLFYFETSVVAFSYTLTVTHP